VIILQLRCVKKGCSGVGFSDLKRSNHFVYFTILSPSVVNFISPSHSVFPSCPSHPTFFLSFLLTLVFGYYPLLLAVCSYSLPSFPLVPHHRHTTCIYYQFFLSSRKEIDQCSLYTRFPLFC